MTLNTGFSCERTSSSESWNWTPMEPISPCSIDSVTVWMTREVSLPFNSNFALLSLKSQ